MLSDDYAQAKITWPKIWSISFKPWKSFQKYPDFSINNYSMSTNKANCSKNFEKIDFWKDWFNSRPMNHERSHWRRHSEFDERYKYKNKMSGKIIFSDWITTRKHLTTSFLMATEKKIKSKSFHHMKSPYLTLLSESALSSRQYRLSETRDFVSDFFLKCGFFQRLKSEK